MTFQTVFYVKTTGLIINIVPNKYISSKGEKLRFCPGRTHDEVNFLYFKADIPIDPGIHTVHYINSTQPPHIVDLHGRNLIHQSIKIPFMRAIEKFSNIIIDMADSMGDKLYRAAAVIEAQKVYPSIRFFCKAETPYKEILEFIPEITLFQDYKAHGLDPKQCGYVLMPAAHFVNARDLSFTAPSGYGFYLGLDYVPYTLKLSLPEGFDEGFKEFNNKTGLRKDSHNVTFQLRTKNEESRSWDVPKAIELARMIKEVVDCNIYWVGSSIDFSSEHRDIINLAGKTTWPETIHLLRSSSHVFCIDSSVLHLCNALKISPYVLWGRTNPESVLDRPAGPRDIFSSYPSEISNIKEISPVAVFTRAFPIAKRFSFRVHNAINDYSEHGDQKIILKFFEDNPPRNNILVDVGAYGKDMSNTHALLEQGWIGLLIEANPARAKIIEKEFADLNVKILGIGISDAVGTIPFYLHSVPGHGSFDPDWYPETKTKKKIKVDVYPLSDVLANHNIPLDFDFLSIDTEGLDRKILNKLFTSSDYRPRLIVTEWNADTDATGLFERYGYKQIGKTGAPGYENLFFAKKD